MLKKIIFIVIWFYLTAKNTFAVSDVIKNGLIQWINWDSETVVNNIKWKQWINDILTYAKNTIFDLLALIVIWVFLYIWYKIVISRWNPEEFKKAFMMLIYAVLWMLFVALAWVIVVFISGLKI